MLGKTWEKECMGSYGMMCVMWVLDEVEPKEVTNVVTSSKCRRQVLEKFLDVMLEGFRGITKFGLRKGMKKRLFTTQGMAHTNSW